MKEAKVPEAECEQVKEALRRLLPWAELAMDSDNMFTWSYADLKRDLDFARKALTGP